MKQVENCNQASCQADDRSEQGEDRVHRFEHVIEKNRQSDIERGRDEVGDEPLGGLPAPTEPLGEYCGQKVE